MKNIIFLLICTYQVLVLQAETIVDFSFSVINDLNVSFTNKSTDFTGPIWDFGDGTGSQLNSSATIIHPYNKDGVYEVKLTVMGSDNTVKTCTKSINVCRLTADFYCSVSEIFENNEVQFFSKYLDCTLATYKWSFGDGSVSTEKNPKHIFKAFGYHNVNLTIVTNGQTLSTSQSFLVKGDFTINGTVTDFSFNGLQGINVKATIGDVVENAVTNSTGQFSIVSSYSGQKIILEVIDPTNMYLGTRSYEISKYEILKITPFYAELVRLSDFYLEITKFNELSYNFKLKFPGIYSGRSDVSNHFDPNSCSNGVWDFQTEYSYKYSCGANAIVKNPCFRINLNNNGKSIGFSIAKNLSIPSSSCNTPTPSFEIKKGKPNYVGGEIEIFDYSYPRGKINSIKVDWADGTEPVVYTLTNHEYVIRSFKHQYTKAGLYGIKLYLNNSTESTNLLVGISDCIVTTPQWISNVPPYRTMGENGELYFFGNSLELNNSKAFVITDDYINQGFASRVIFEVCGDNKIVIKAPSNINKTYTFQSIETPVYITTKSAEIGGIDGHIVVEGKEINTFKFFPNPAQGSLSVQLKEGTINSIKIFEMSGKNVFSSSLNASQGLLDISNIKPGIYFIQAGTNSEVFTEKLIIK